MSITQVRAVRRRARRGHRRGHGRTWCGAPGAARQSASRSAGTRASRAPPPVPTHTAILSSTMDASPVRQDDVVGHLGSPHPVIGRSTVSSSKPCGRRRARGGPDGGGTCGSGVSAPLGGRIGGIPHEAAPSGAEAPLDTRQKFPDESHDRPGTSPLSSTPALSPREQPSCLCRNLRSPITCRRWRPRSAVLRWSGVREECGGERRA